MRKAIIETIGWPVPYYLQILFDRLREHFEGGVQPSEALVEQIFDELPTPAHKGDFDYWRQRLHDELGSPEDNQAIPQHRLILGQRGMGKTSLVRRLAIAVDEDPELSATWLPLTFPEEQYNIAHLSDLWLNCLDALGDALERSGQTDQSDDLDARIEFLAQADSDDVLQALLDQAHRLDRRLLILGRLHDEDWALREALQSHPELLVFAASAGAIEASYCYDAAFYDLFRIDELKGITEEERRATLIRLSELGNTPAVTELVERDPARIRTLHTLTGGNPRTAVLLYGVLAQGPSGDVRTDLEGLLDRVTPLYTRNSGRSRNEFSPTVTRAWSNASALNQPVSTNKAATRARPEIWRNGRWHSHRRI